MKKKKMDEIKLVGLFMAAIMIVVTFTPATAKDVSPLPPGGEWNIYMGNIEDFDRIVYTADTNEVITTLLNPFIEFGDDEIHIPLAMVYNNGVYITSMNFSWLLRINLVLIKEDGTSQLYEVFLDEEYIGQVLLEDRGEPSIGVTIYDDNEEIVQEGQMDVYLPQGGWSFSDFSWWRLIPIIVAIIMAVGMYLSTPPPPPPPPPAPPQVTTTVVNGVIITVTTWSDGTQRIVEKYPDGTIIITIIYPNGDMVIREYTSNNLRPIPEGAYYPPYLQW